MSQWTRLASSDTQEEGIKRIEKLVQEAGKNIMEGVIIGKSPQIVILDLVYHGSEIYVSSDGRTHLNNERIDDYDDESIIQMLKNLYAAV